MRISRRTVALPSLALVAAMSMSACQDSGSAAPTAAAPNTASSSPSASSTAPASAPATGTSPSASDDSSTAPAANATGAQAPTAQREDAKDTSSLDAETSAIPAGPVKGIDIKKLGGYSDVGANGRFYSVLDVTCTEPGLLSLQYVLLDASGTELKTVDRTISVDGTAHELKITNAGNSLPGASEGVVKKVRLRVVKNEANEFATDAVIDPSISTSVDPESKLPLVKGRYKTNGKGTIVELTAICNDVSGRVITGSSPVDKIEATTWTPYTVSLFDAPDVYTPTRCYVGA